MLINTQTEARRRRKVIDIHVQNKNLWVFNLGDASERQDAEPGIRLFGRLEGYTSPSILQFGSEVKFHPLYQVRTDKNSGVDEKNTMGKSNITDQTYHYRYGIVLTLAIWYRGVVTNTVEIFVKLIGPD